MHPQHFFFSNGRTPIQVGSSLYVGESTLQAYFETQNFSASPTSACKQFTAGRAEGENPVIQQAIKTNSILHAEDSQKWLLELHWAVHVDFYAQGSITEVIAFPFRINMFYSLLLNLVFF